MAGARLAIGAVLACASMFAQNKALSTLVLPVPGAPLSAEVVSQLRPEPPKLICGGAAYIPDKASGEEREAAELYLRFLEGHCEAH